MNQQVMILKHLKSLCVSSLLMAFEKGGKGQISEFSVATCLLYSSCG
jgi:hypothetical protein